MVHPGIEKRVKPFPSAFVTVAFTRVLTRDAEPKLVHGLLPREMEDKWYVRLADGYLDFFRSWTGHHIYRIPVTVADAALTLGDLLVNNDTEQWNPSAIRITPKLLIRSLIEHWRWTPRRTHNMVFTQIRGFGNACSFGKLMAVATLIGFDEK